MGKRQTRKRKAQQKQTINALAIMGVAVAAIIAIGWLLLERLFTQVAIDEITNCPIDEQSSITAVLIDTTDTLNRSQAIFIENSLLSMLKSSNLYDKFVVYYVNQDIEQVKAEVEVCNPGDGKNESEFTANKRRIMSEWQDSFFNKLSSVFSTLETAPVAQQSPILETAKILSAEEYIGFQAAHKRLIIISDLLQHSDALTHYNSEYQITDDYFQTKVVHLLPYLEGVVVEIYYVTRPSISELQTNKHILFWEKVIKESGGTLADVIMVK